MREKIVQEMVKAYAGYDGLSELQRGLKLAMAVTDKYCGWTENDYNEMWTEIVYRLARLEK